VCLDWGEDVWGFDRVDVWGWEESVKKVRLFGLGFVRVDVWEKFMRVCEWWNGWGFFIFFLKV